MFTTYADDPALRQVDVVGLGAGTLAAYGRPGQTMRFYELDPQIVAVARDPKLFSYLADSRADRRPSRPATGGCCSTGSPTAPPACSCSTRSPPTPSRRTCSPPRRSAATPGSCSRTA